MLAYSPSVLRIVTFRLLNPPPCGVVIGALSKTRVCRSVSHEASTIPALCPARYTFSPISIGSVDPRAGRVQDGECGRHDLRADAVTVRDRDRYGAFGERTPVGRGSTVPVGALEEIVWCCGHLSSSCVGWRAD